MLDTGIDVPEVLNLVFFKLVRSKTKFWQMIGRGTRLCPNLIAPGRDKEYFILFDYCQNLEYFSQALPATEGRVGESLGAKLFKSRLDLIGAIDTQIGPPAQYAAADSGIEPTSGLLEKDVRRAAAETLHRAVESMNVDNFVVRPKRRIVEKYAKRESWNVLPAESRSELAHYVASLPTELDPENEEAKRFDLLLLKLQLARLTQGHGFERMRDQVKDIAGMLEEKASIPMVSAQMPLILEIQTDHWWQDVTVGMLEGARRRLRDLVQLIEKAKRKRLYSDFEDEMGAAVEFDLPGFKEAADLAKFRAKAQAFLKAHQDHIAISKLRMNRSLTATDSTKRYHWV